METPRKPFKDTRLGQLLLAKAPRIADAVADLLPQSGTLGIVRNLIHAATPDELSEADKAALLAEAAAEEERYLEILRIEAADRDSARKRETEIIATGNADWLTRNLTSLLAVLVVGLGFLFFFLVLFTKITVHMGDRDMAMMSLGAIIGLVGSVINYYFGSSAGSRRKENMLRNSPERTA